jgi:hypothetical protein
MAKSETPRRPRASFAGGKPSPLIVAAIPGIVTACAVFLLVGFLNRTVERMTRGETEYEVRRISISDLPADPLEMPPPPSPELALENEGAAAEELFPAIPILEPVLEPDELESELARPLPGAWAPIALPPPPGLLEAGAPHQPRPPSAP